MPDLFRAPSALPSLVCHFRASLVPAAASIFMIIPSTSSALVAAAASERDMWMPQELNSLVGPFSHGSKTMW